MGPKTSGPSAKPAMNTLSDSAARPAGTPSESAISASTGNPMSVANEASVVSAPSSSVKPRECGRRRCIEFGSLADTHRRRATRPRSHEVYSIGVTRPASTTDAPLIERVLRPFQQFIATEAASGIVLLATTALALVLANSPLASAYRHALEIPLAIGLAPFRLELSLHAWV